MNRVSSFFSRHHRKIKEIGVGLFAYQAVLEIYDFIFYPFALAYWGLLVGGVIAVGFAFVINIVVFWLYDYMRVDWLGAHALRELENAENKSSFHKIATWLGRKKETLWEKIMSPIVFAGLLLPVDPVIVAIHFQREHFKGLGWRDWGLLLLASAIANMWWLVKIGAIVESVRYVWQAP